MANQTSPLSLEQVRRQEPASEHEEDQDSGAASQLRMRPRAVLQDGRDFQIRRRHGIDKPAGKSTGDLRGPRRGSARRRVRHDKPTPAYDMAAPDAKSPAATGMAMPVLAVPVLPTLIVFRFVK